MKEQMHFLRRLLADPRNVGAVAPSGASLARAMAAQINASQPGPVLELGPGSGAITKELLAAGIAPERITVVERDPQFVSFIANRFPGVKIASGDALNLLNIPQVKDAAPFIGAVSGIPLLNFPLATRQALLDLVFAQLMPGAPFIQFSYGLHSPIPARADISVTRAARIWNNLPPAQVWVYRKR